MKNTPFTLAHITHEAVEHVGGIGTVLEGLITSPVYQKDVGRTILVGPTQAQMTIDPEARLGEQGEVLYSSIDQLDRVNLSGKLRPVEWAFNVAIVYGKRHFKSVTDGRHGEAEVLLIDVSRVNHDRLNVFKLRLWETFGLDSSRYENEWDFEEYLRLAEPAYYTLLTLLGPEALPCILFSHEFMGIPTALQAILDGQSQFHTVFHAHECATARQLIEGHLGHDTMFYNILSQSRDQDLYLDDVFGNCDHFFRHALISKAHLCDGLIAVGDRTRDELRFFNQRFDKHPIDLVYNGVPNMKVDLKSKNHSRAMLLEYAKAVVGYTPHVLMTHVSRPVISKGIWRDLKVCHELDRRFEEQSKTGVLFILTSAKGVLRPQDVLAMERQYDWPRCHRHGYPDLVGPEAGFHADITTFNKDHKQIQIVLVNQFGWSAERIGRRLPRDMNIADLRRATDVEFGMATYEPFGISPLEPLCSGAICVISNVCGCYGFVLYATQNAGAANVIVADFTRLDRPRSIDELMTITQAERDTIEQTISVEVSDQMMQRLPWTDQARSHLIESGQKLAKKMGWDQVIEKELMPMLERIRTVPEDLTHVSGRHP